MATSRIDFEIGEDADFIVIADASSQSELQSARDMIAAGLKNEAFVLPLPEDGGISGRVVFDALNDDEQDNWVARAERPLQVRTPKIVFDAGDFFGRELGVELGVHNNHLVVEIEPGNYVLTCLVYLTSDIATDLFKRHKFSYLELFLKSHPNRKIPSWLIEEAECRDNEADEEWCETIDDDRIDHESSDRFVDILFHFQKDAVVETPTSVSKTGKIKWEKRIPKKFPTPLFNSVAKQSTSAKKITSEIASAFFRNDFESVVAFFSKHLQSAAIPFLCDMHRQVSAKMTIPQKKCPGDSLAESGDWIAKRDRAACIVDVATLQAFPFAGSCLCELAAEPKRNKRSSVSFHTAFTKTAEGLRVAAIEVKWAVPIERKRRRSRITNGPPCPECGEPLATDLAKQCMHCGANLE